MKNAELGKEYYIMILIIFIKQCCIYTYYIGYGFKCTNEV